MKHTTVVRLAAAARSAITVAVLVVLMLVPVQSLLAQGKGQSTLSVGITISAADSTPAATAEDKRIPVDPAYAIRDEDPLRDARVERVTAADGQQLRVVTY